MYQLSEPKRRSLIRFSLTFLSFISIITVFAQNASTVSTFHNLSVYWSPAGGSSAKQVLVEYKTTGQNTWKNALSMKYNPIAGAGTNPKTGKRYDKADYRGSIVNLIPNTTYDIRLSLEGTQTTTTLQASTWNEEFPIGETKDIENLTTRLSYGSLKGSANGYILINGMGKTIDIQDGSPQCIRLIDCEYIILRGFTLKNAAESAIRLYNSHHIIIEDCNMSNWGEEDVVGTGFGKGYQAGVYAGSDDAHHVVIQRNKIHHPRWDTNSWAELHDPASDPDKKSNYHPDGPQGIALGQCNIGNNVIRYNEIWSDKDHYFNDILGMWSNASYAGFPGSDSDIYGNYLANCFDDGIESEGSNTNVRIWNNYIEEVFIGIGNAATSVGPLYIWRNVTGKAGSMPNSVYGQYGGFVKMGFAHSIDWMTGHMYMFNNTILQPNNQGTGGLGTSDGSNRYILHCDTRNNIFHVRDETTNSIAIRSSGNIDNNFDYDLTNHPYPNGHEEHGISGVPTYVNGAPSFSFTTKTGNFKLAVNSLGFDKGIVIPNFSDYYQGSAPDIGAHEHGTDAIIYGVKANFVPFESNTLAIDDVVLNTIQVYPIPTDRLLHITNPQGNKLEFFIYDIKGSLILKDKFTTQNKSLNLEHLIKGIYYLKIQNTSMNSSKNVKLILN